MKMHPIISSNIASIGYDPETRVLLVEFRSGTVYDHADVAPDLFAKLMAADSHGTFYNAHIRKAHPSTQVLDAEANLAAAQQVGDQEGRFYQRRFGGIEAEDAQAALDAALRRFRGE